MKIGYVLVENCPTTQFGAFVAQEEIIEATTKVNKQQDDDSKENYERQRLVGGPEIYLSQRRKEKCKNILVTNYISSNTMPPINQNS